MGKRGYMKTVAFALAMVFISGTALTGCGGKKQVDYGLEGYRSYAGFKTQCSRILQR